MAEWFSPRLKKRGKPAAPHSSQKQQQQQERQQKQTNKQTNLFDEWMILSWFQCCTHLKYISADKEGNYMSDVIWKATFNFI